MRRALATSLGLGVALGLGLALACDAVDATSRAPASAARPAAPALAPAASFDHVELVTGGARPDDPLPLVVAVHGLGDTPQGLVPLFDGFDLPARIVLPRAPTPYQGGGSWFPLPWDEGEAAFESGVASASEQLGSFLDAVARERPTRGRPVVTGFSQGGILSFAIATARPDRVSAALPIAGFLPEALWPRVRPAGAVPIRALHGAADELLRAEPTQRLVAHLRAIGFDAEITLYPGVGHRVSREMLRDFHARLAELVQRVAAEPAP